MKTKEKILLETFSKILDQCPKGNPCLMCQLAELVSESKVLEDAVISLEHHLIGRCLNEITSGKEDVIDAVAKLVNKLFRAGFLFGVKAADNIRIAQSTGECE